MNQSEIILRAVELKDCELMYDFENDTHSWTDGITTRFYSAYAIEQYVLNTQNEDIFSSCQTRLMIDVKTANSVKTVGCVDLYDIDAVHSRAGVGIYIAKEQGNNGYASKALDKLYSYASNILNLHQLYAFVAEDNAISNRLFESCNYKLTANLKDWLKKGNKYQNVNVWQRICD